MMKIGTHVFKRYAGEHSSSAAVQCLNNQSQDMTMSSDSEEILTSLSTINDIREDNGGCLNMPKVYHHPHAIQESYISNPRCLVRYVYFQNPHIIFLISSSDEILC